MAAFIAPLIGGVGSLLGGILGATTASKAGKNISNAAQAGTTAIGTAGNQAAAATNQAVTQGQGLYGTAIQGVQGATAAGQNLVNNAYGNTTSLIQGANNVAGNLLGGQLQAVSPYMATGNTGTAALQNQVNNPFQAPTAAQVQATPGYQFQLQQGLQGVEQQLGASGGAATGGALKALTQYGQNVASTYYQNAFNNALNAYNTNTNTAATAAGQGLSATGMANQASENFGNTYNNNALFSANQGMNAAEYNSTLGMQGAGTAASLLSGEAGFGLSGAETAGNQNLAGTEAASNMFLQGSEASAAASMGGANALSGALTGMGNAALALPAAYGGFGGSVYGGGPTVINNAAGPGAPYGYNGYGQPNPPPTWGIWN